MHAIEGSEKRENEEENYSTQNNFAKRLLLIQPWGTFSILDSLPMQQEMQFFNEREERIEQHKKSTEKRVWIFLLVAFVSHSFSTRILCIFPSRTLFMFLCFAKHLKNLFFLALFFLHCVVHL